MVFNLLIQLTLTTFKATLFGIYCKFAVNSEWTTQITIYIVLS